MDFAPASAFSVPCLRAQNPKKIPIVQNPHAEVHTVLMSDTRTFVVRPGYSDIYTRTIFKVTKQWTK